MTKSGVDSSRKKSLEEYETVDFKMNKWSELFLGMILLIGVIVLAWASSAYNWVLFGKSFNFLSSAWIVLKGGLFWMIFFVGLLFIILGITDLKD
ncbi:MAG TPA: hypothetical protein VJH92_02670 [Candidatus Nanoarchaeia archaeon]|nr:hypothetical protein [Candidatus Nanoarchaeia archaeon]